MKAIQNRPDLRAAQQGVTAADSQIRNCQSRWKTRRHRSGKLLPRQRHQCRHGSYASIPLAIYNRNQGEIARTRYVITQAQEQQAFTNGQVLTDVKDAYEGVESNDRLVKLYICKYLDVATKSRDISEYAYQRGGLALLDFLDAERSYRADELGYRQTLASYLLALEQLREAVGARNLP